VNAQSQPHLIILGIRECIFEQAVYKVGHKMPLKVPWSSRLLAVVGEWCGMLSDVCVERFIPLTLVYSHYIHMP